jgi:hypothetical protein
MRVFLVRRKKRVCERVVRKKKKKGTVGAKKRFLEELSERRKVCDASFGKS